MGYWFRLPVLTQNTGEDSSTRTEGVLLITRSTFEMAGTEAASGLVFWSCDIRPQPWEQPLIVPALRSAGGTWMSASADVWLITSQLSDSGNTSQ
jgi:hypothetical protein